jgi:hypothetical protein
MPHESVDSDMPHESVSDALLVSVENMSSALSVSESSLVSVQNKFEEPASSALCAGSMTSGQR